MRDVFGQRLADDVSFDIDTEAPFMSTDGKVIDPKLAAGPNPSAASVSSETQASSEDEAAAASDAEAAAKNDKRPRRPLLSYDLTLGVRGHVVEAVPKDGKRAHVVPIGSLNLPTYGLFAQKMRPEDALAWLNNRRRRPYDPLRWTWVSPGVPENTRAVKDIDLDALLGGSNARGAALLAVASPGAADSPQQSELLTVTDIGISAAMSSYGSMVWVTRLSTGQPLPNAVVSVQRCTVFGIVDIHSMQLGESSIFTSCVNVARRQLGCMRFSYVPRGCRTPKRYHCQPDGVIAAVMAAISDPQKQRVELANEQLRVTPQFTSVRYGTPTYAQLGDTCADEIKRGADDESEMGAYHGLYQPQRKANLRERLAEYTPAAMDVGIIFAN